MTTLELAESEFRTEGVKQGVGFDPITIIIMVIGLIIRCIQNATAAQISDRLKNPGIVTRLQVHKATMRAMRQQFGDTGYHAMNGAAVERTVFAVGARATPEEIESLIAEARAQGLAE